MQATLMRLDRAMAAQPLTTSLVVTGIKSSAADILVQSTVEGKGLTSLDQRRVLLFGTFGIIYQGGFQYFLLNHAFERAFPGRGVWPTVKKICAMNLIGDPVFFFPCFYTMKEVFRTSVLTRQTVYDALSKYRDNFKEDW